MLKPVFLTRLCALQREPRIAADCSPIYCNLSGTRELIGHASNERENTYTCHFFDRQTHGSTIYETKLFVCHVFDWQRVRAPRIMCYGTQYDSGSERLAPLIASASPWQRRSSSLISPGAMQNIPHACRGCPIVFVIMKP